MVTEPVCDLKWGSEADRVLWHHRAEDNQSSIVFYIHWHAQGWDRHMDDRDHCELQVTHSNYKGSHAMKLILYEMSFKDIHRDYPWNRWQIMDPAESIRITWSCYDWIRDWSYLQQGKLYCIQPQFSSLWVWMVQCLQFWVLKCTLKRCLARWVLPSQLW